MTFLKLKAICSFRSPIKIIEEKLIIVLSRTENTTANVTFVAVCCISHWRFSVFSLTEDISISRAYFYLQYNHRETRAINPTEAGREKGGRRPWGATVY